MLQLLSLHCTELIGMTEELGKMNNKQKREIVVKALHACNARIVAMQADSNPQVKEMYIKNKGYQAALEDVLLLLDGNPSHINCLI